MIEVRQALAMVLRCAKRGSSNVEIWRRVKGLKALVATPQSLEFTAAWRRAMVFSAAQRTT